jgi:hypothetical protein
MNDNFCHIFLNEDGIPYCACGLCDELVNWNNQGKCWYRFAVGHWNKGKKLSSLKQEHKDKIARALTKNIKSPPQICECGECGLMTNPGRKFITGHNRKGKPNSKKQKEDNSKRMQGNIYALGKHWNLTEEGKQNHKKAWQDLLNDPSRRKSYVEKLSLALTDKPKSDKHRKNLSIVCSDGRRAGSNNANWNGGTSFLPYPPQFNSKLKNKIQKRDNHTCQICGDVKTIYSENGWAVHHIDYDRQNNDDSNLIFLCECCHNKTSQIRNREKWIIMLKNKIREKEVIAA